MSYVRPVRKLAKMKNHYLAVSIAIAGLCAVNSAQAAAVVTCTQSAYTMTVTNGICHGATGNTLSYGGFSGLRLQNGALQATAYAELITLPDPTAGAFPISAGAMWDDTFNLPSSPSGDIIQVIVDGGGLGHPASIQIGDIDYTTPDFCDAHYTGNPACTVRETMSAGAVSTVRLTGSDSVTIGGPCVGNCGFSANADLYEYVTINRFLADGVTSDPFTSLIAAPEPSAFGLLAAGVLTLIFAVQRKAPNRSVAATRSEA